jgi:uncharacterized membrane protein HdeD (DUF308 family)
MNHIIKNILAVIAGAVIGSVVNMAIVMISGKIIPPPLGADVTTMEGLKATLHLFEPKHFIMPFIAHALGTFAGAWIAAAFAASRKMTFAYVIGALFLVGGVMNLFMLPSPVWYSITDIVLAYLPMAYLGGKLNSKKK